VKYLIPLALLATLLLFACGDNSISPIETDNHSYQLIKLPPKAGLSIENTFSVTKRINGKKGGSIKLKESYTAPDGHKVKIDVDLKIKKNSFSGNVDITMTVDDVYAAVSFSPHMVFNKPVELKVKFEGINLEELDLTNGDYDFVYIDDEGNIEPVQHDRIDVDENKGKIKFHGRKGKAKLNHFSRYAFIR
jgi:hypothetical protein